MSAVPPADRVQLARRLAELRQQALDTISVGLATPGVGTSFSSLRLSDINEEIASIENQLASGDSGDDGPEPISVVR